MEIPKKPTRKEIREAARILALGYIYSVTSGDRKSFAEKIVDALELLNDDDDAASHVYESIWIEIAKLEKQWPSGI